MAFYAAAFGAEEAFRLANPNGSIAHAEFAIGGTRVMIADEHPDFGALSPQAIGGSPVKLHIAVDDAAAALARAEAAGATVVRPVTEEFYGERTAMVADPFGYSWFLAEKTEEVSPEEMQARWSAVMEG
ncbi:MAG: VOC family protein [Caulobacterales bacterium]|nr:VOC family protein [Caulobacterales bacterium]